MNLHHGWAIPETGASADQGPLESVGLWGDGRQIGTLDSAFGCRSLTFPGSLIGTGSFLVAARIP
jgi:hypothetical protein